MPPPAPRLLYRCVVADFVNTNSTIRFQIGTPKLAFASPCIYAVGYLTSGDGMNEQKPLHEQIAIVTGGSRGIGAAIARQLAGMGARVIIIGRDRAALNAMEKELTNAGLLAEACTYDVTSCSQVSSLAAYIGKEFGRLDILVNNAGVGSFGVPLHEMKAEDWDRVINTNLRGVYYTIHAFAPMMIERKYGHIINISSITSKNAVPNAACYVASKWALNGLSVSVAEELRNYGIRVSLILPGSTDTELRRTGSGDPGKMLRPEDVAHVVEMLVTQSEHSFASEIILRPTRKP
jgi:3-oxoacyl-[acyl-carrier protein] reductase